MLRIFALVAAVGMAATAGTAGAHPPDLYGSYGNDYNSGYKYEVPVTTQPYYGGSYGTSAYTSPSYVSPSYSGAAYGGYTSAPTYTTPSYVAPNYTTPQGYGYSGYSAPGYGYRHRRASRYHRGSYGIRNPYANYPVSAYGHRGFGPLNKIPSTEGLNVGFAGGPTFGTDQNPVINGVRLNAAPD